MAAGWKYYNHALIPTTEPHENCIFPENKYMFWKIGGGGYPLFARWTSNFDCGYATNWWYVIKDTPFDISELKAKRRYEINKGKKNFTVKRIVATDYLNNILEVTKKAFLSWPEKYRPSIDDDDFKNSLSHWNSAVIYGAFDRENDSLSGYAYLTEYKGHLEFNMLRVIPECERLGINAAICSAILEDNNDRFDGKWYINDGARSIRHETAFQDYLEKYFGFRKAFCKLEIMYRNPYGLVIKMLFPFRQIIGTSSRVGSIISSLLKMEEIRRESNK